MAFLPSGPPSGTWFVISSGASPSSINECKMLGGVASGFLFFANSGEFPGGVSVFSVPFTSGFLHTDSRTSGLVSLAMVLSIDLRTCVTAVPSPIPVSEALYPSLVYGLSTDG